MKQAMVNALQQQVIQLENNNKYLSNLNDDTVLVGNCLAECLKILLSGNRYVLNHCRGSRNYIPVTRIAFTVIHEQNPTWIPSIKY